MKNGVTKVLEGLPKFLRVSREGLALLNTNLLRVWIDKAIRRRNLIKVNGILTKNRIFVENSEDYEFVLRYITERCPKLKQNEQSNQPKKTTT